MVVSFKFSGSDLQQTMLRPGRFSVNSAGEEGRVHGVAPTVSGENRDSKVYGAETSWSCAQEGQNTQYRRK